MIKSGFCAWDKSLHFRKCKTWFSCEYDSFLCLNVDGGGGGAGGAEVRIANFGKKKPSSSFNYYKRMT